MDNLAKQFKYYQENKKDFLSQYENKFIVILNQKVIGAFDDRIEAINETKKKHELGTFLVQEAKEGADVAFFHSRVFPIRV